MIILLILYSYSVIRYLNIGYFSIRVYYNLENILNLVITILKIAFFQAIHATDVTLLLY